MQNFSIRQIELLTGIKSHTLRIWEQRYDFFKAQRKESNMRFYTNEDLKKLLCISFLGRFPGSRRCRMKRSGKKQTKQTLPFPIIPLPFNTY
ncbi:MAG: MerR family transcriptional regulator [Chitinophagaceae bacterium]|nr:MAG: MerR family transcriptional regulator [Chitinophagaceae bacterium]